MEFGKVKEAAERWTATGKTQFRVTGSHATDRRLVFTADDVSFYVLCPETAEGQWGVWSDDERVQNYMTPIQDFVGSCRKKTVAEVLTYTDKNLRPLLGEEDAGDCDMEEDFADPEEDREEEEDEDEGWDEEIYYGEDDTDALQDRDPALQQQGEAASADSFFTGDGSQTAVHRLLKDLKNMQDADGKFGVRGSPRGDNLFVWDVQLTEIPKDTLLGKDMLAYAKQYKQEPVIHMEMKFPKDYPMAPPFVRILKPRFQFLTGHVTVGGSVCMEMLTRSGWRPTNDIESILVQIRAEILSDPKTRLDKNSNKPYDEVEAQTAFQRMVQRYGWDK